VTGIADTGIFSRDLRRLFIEIGELAREQSVGVLFALDEVHTLGEGELDNLNSALHQTAQRQLPVAFIGAGLFPSWQNSGPERRDPTRLSSYPARMYAATYVRLEPLDADESKRALTGPAMTEQVTYTDEALDFAVGFCEGSAWVLQLLGATAWEAAQRSPIDRDAITAAIARVEDQLGQWFFPRLLRSCSHEELRMLAKIADLETDVVRFESVASATEKAISFELIARLAQRDLITLDYSVRLTRDNFGIRFSVPLLGEYLRAHD
jgi:hypothetical protein